MRPWPHHRWRAGASERGQVSVLILGYAVVVVLLIVGTVAVTSVELSRVRLLDAADGAALDAADSLDAVAYHRGLGASVVLTDDSVAQTARAYLAARPRPASIRAWSVSASSGSPDGQTAVVRLTGEAEVPLVGAMLRALGGSLTITVESRARAPIAP